MFGKNRHLSNRMNEGNESLRQHLYCKHIRSPEQVFQHCSDYQPDQLKCWMLTNQKDGFAAPDRPRQLQTQYDLCVLQANLFRVTRRSF